MESAIHLSEVPRKQLTRRGANVYQKTVLDNGLRILTTTMPHTRSVAVGIFTGVGSRYENEQQRGISHFIEHMMFKGTEHRPSAQQLSEAIEGLGGEMNASTDRELTLYEVKVADHHLPIALDVLVDMFRHSKLDPEETDKERQVIIQEISRMMDVPEAWVHILIANQLWPEHPVGWETAGTKESVSAISREDMLDYIERTYTPCSTVISLAGNLDHDHVISQLEAELGSWQHRSVPGFLPARDAPAGPTVRLESRDTEQAHLCLGLRGLARNDPDRFKLALLNAVLGEGMSSRLFLEIREKRGLAYSVGSYALRLRDTGAMVLHAGVEPQKAGDALSAMIEQLQILRDQPVPVAELNKAREYTKGGILLSMEDTFANVGWVGRQELLDPQVLTVDEVMEKLDAVTAADVQAVAQRLFATEKLHLAMVGPFKDEAPFATRLRL
jgi:predicted Zn-dependent peptidase